MQKRSVSGSSGNAASGSAVDAMTALTAAVQELQAAMNALAGSFAGGIQTPPHLTSPTEGRGTDTPPHLTSPTEGRGTDTPPHLASPTRGEEFGTDSPAGDKAPPYGARAALDEREGQRLLRHSEQLRDAGELTPEEDLTLTEEMERLATDETKASASLAHGTRIEDYLAALSANRPAAFLRADTVELTGIWRGRRGDEESGREGECESGGRGQGQEQEQEQGYGITGGLGNIHLPLTHSLTPTLQDTERLAEAVGRLADAILHGGGRSGSALHPGEAQGGLNGLLQSARVGVRPDGYN
jgi:hypothetical protein